MNSNYIYHNADNSYKIKPKNTYFPKNLKEIIDIVKNNSNRKIRVSSSIHTFNDMSICDDIIIRLSNLKNILNMNHEKKTVLVEAGILLYIFVQELEKYNLALQVSPDCMWQSLGGAISTSTHGSRIDRGSLSDSIISITMILYNGIVINIKKGDKMFPAATVSLGTLGIIYLIELQCEELYYIEETQIKMKWNEFIKNIYKILKNNTYTQLIVNPKDKTCNILVRKKIEIKDKINIIKEKIYFNVISELEESNPYTEIEITIPIKYLDEAINEIFILYENNINFNTLLIRFVGINKNSFIGMSSDRKYNATISIFGEAKNSSNHKLLNLFEKFQKTLLKYKGRPHYGKKLFLNKKEMKKLYPKLQKFIDVRNELDPHKIFTNDYIKRLLD